METPRRSTLRAQSNALSLCWYRCTDTFDILEALQNERAQPYQSKVFLALSLGELASWYDTRFVLYDLYIQHWLIRCVFI